MKLRILAAVALCASLAISSCGGLAFTAANAPALFGAFERRADLAFGTYPRQRLDVYVPDDARDRPIIVFWYGGAWERGSKERYRFVGAALAEAGYVAVIPDYRLHPEVKFPVFVDDGAAALAWTIEHAAQIGGDPARLFVAGHSAGAHLAALLAYDPSRLERGGLRRDAVRGFIGLSGPYALDPDTDVLRAIFAAPYGLDDWQPTRLVRSPAPAALLLHGDADDVVGVSHARALADALSRATVPVELRVYAHRGHRDTVAALARVAPDKLPVLEEIRRFVERN